MADINPLRYRGYYYDTETGFYYLQSRYYDSVTHRFINADSYASTDYTDAIACNMFAYCGNNPVIWIDAEGNRPFVYTMMTDGGGGKPQKPILLDLPSADFYKQNSEIIDAEIAKYANYSGAYVEIMQTSSKLVDKKTRIADYLEKRKAEVLMATMLTLAFGPIGDFAIAKSAYGNVTGAIEIVGIGLDLYNGTNNTDGIYQTYTIFVDTSEMMCGLLMKKTTVLRYQWFKHNHAASWTLELISADEYYTRR